MRIKQYPAVRLPFLAVALAILLNVTGCTGEKDAVVSVDRAIELRVMTFNIEWGGANISFDNVVEAIRLSQADIVGIQEAEGNLQRLAAELGWNYDLRNYAISKYPLLNPPGADRQFVYVEVQPGRVVALANVHLPSDPYGVDLVRDGAPLDDVLELEKTTRLSKLLPYLASLKPLLDNDTPVFLTGDFNAPAHTDWTDDMVGTRPFLRFAVDWPVSRAVANAGFTDSWRESHPNPRTAPGLTWWAGRAPLDSYTPSENDPKDRIDFVWYAGPARTLSSTLVGEAGAPDVTISVSPWPSDHRAVLSTFLVDPAEAPRLASAEHRIYNKGEDVLITYRHALDSEIGIEGLDFGADAKLVTGSPISGNGEARFAADIFSTGHYNVSMSTPGQQTLNSDFWVVDSSAAPAVYISGDSFRVGESIGISWRNGPGNRNDYLGVYEVGVGSGYDPNYDGGLTWLYVNAQPAGSVRLDESTSEVVWPLPPGRFVVRLLKDDGYEILAESAAFDIH